uniref:ATP-binding protein n=1 Tax=Clostridium perfringens TaxID=1502 RepID=UPI0039E768E9
TKENKESNNGFGLAIVKELVESYNGKIQVSSTDEFTEFTIYLPTIKFKKKQSSILCFFLNFIL